MAPHFVSGWVPQTLLTSIMTQIVHNRHSDNISSFRNNPLVSGNNYTLPPGNSHHAVLRFDVHMLIHSQWSMYLNDLLHRPLRIPQFGFIGSPNYHSETLSSLIQNLQQDEVQLLVSSGLTSCRLIDTAYSNVSSPWCHLLYLVGYHQHD